MVRWAMGRTRFCRRAGNPRFGRRARRRSPARVEWEKRSSARVEVSGKTFRGTCADHSSRWRAARGRGAFAPAGYEMLWRVP